jgi:hypothetical protein
MTFGTTLVEVPNIKFDDNPSSGSLADK